MLKKEDIEKYGESSKIIKYFQEIDKIPRNSGNEGAVVEYLKNFAIQRGLKFLTDKHNNIIIEKNSTNGKNTYLAFQSHTDMVCEKIPGSTHDFSNDPVDLHITGDYIESGETTIGADNGIGVAFMLSLLDSDNIEHPNLEMIFTSEEETSMNGAKSIDFSSLKSNRIISLDAFSEDTIICGCASNYAKYLSLSKKRAQTPDNTELNSYKINVFGFKGGHSGKEIGDNRGNPIIILGKILAILNLHKNVYLNSIDGGTWVTAIPRNAECVVTTKILDFDKLTQMLKKIEAKLKKQYNCEDISISIESVDTPNKAFDIDTSCDIIKYIANFPDKPILRDRITDDILLSANLGTIWLEDDTLFLENSIRSNIQQEHTELLKKKLANIEESMDIHPISIFDFPGYIRESDSEFLDFLYKQYIETFGKKPKVKEEHILLECAFFADKINNLEYVSISPDILNPHSPNEKVSISSIQRMWEYVKDVVKGIDKNITKNESINSLVCEDDKSR